MMTVPRAIVVCAVSMLIGPGLSGAALGAETDERAATAYRAAVKRADVVYRSALERCRKTFDREKDDCIERAKAVHQQAKLHARVQLRSASVQGRTDTREADYRAALGRCEFYRGRARDICINEANAEYGRN